MSWMKKTSKEDKKDIIKEIGSKWQSSKTKERTLNKRTVQAFVGARGSWKTMTALLSYRFNEDYVDDWGSEYPKAKELLETGALNPIDRVRAVDTEEGLESKVFGIDRNYAIIEEGYVDGKFDWISVNMIDPKDGDRNIDENIDEFRKNVYYLVETSKLTDMTILDSMSCFRGDLQTKLHEMAGRSEVDPKIENQSFYSWRAGKWIAIMKAINKLKGHCVLTFKVKQKFDKDEWDYETGIENVKPLWIETNTCKTSHWIQNAILFNIEKSMPPPGVEIIDERDLFRCKAYFRHEWAVKLAPREFEFYIPYGKNAYIKILDEIADSILRD